MGKELIDESLITPATLWDQKMMRDGHTGWGDKIIHKYDQPLRLKVIKKVINKIQGSINDKKILDIGCGVGDFSFMFAKMGADVSGIDISEEAIKKAKERSEKEHFLCNFLVTSIKDVDFPTQSFDIITSMAVLQHILDYDELLLSAQKMVDLLKTGGYICLWETAPISLNQNMKDSEYMCFRTRKEWIEIFERKGVRLYFEMVHPSLGLSLIRVYNNIARSLYRNIVFKNNHEVYLATKDQNIFEPDSNSKLFKIHSSVKKIILIFSKPIDYYMPFLARFGTTRIMVFKRVK